MVIIDKQWWRRDGHEGSGSERVQQGPKTDSDSGVEDVKCSQGGLLKIKITEGAADSEASVGATRSADNAPAALHLHPPAALLHSCSLALQPRLMVCSAQGSW
jgi:hypothetical protein